MFLPGFYSEVFLGDVTWTREKWKRLTHPRESFTSLHRFESIYHSYSSNAVRQLLLNSSSAFRGISWCHFSPYTFTIPSIFFSGCTVVSFYPSRCLRYLCPSCFLKFPPPDSGWSIHSLSGLGQMVPYEGAWQSGVTLPLLASGRHCVLLRKGCFFLPTKRVSVSPRCVPLGCIHLERISFKKLNLPRGSTFF